MKVTSVNVKDRSMVLHYEDTGFDYFVSLSKNGHEVLGTDGSKRFWTIRHTNAFNWAWEVFSKAAAEEIRYQATRGRRA